MFGFIVQAADPLDCQVPPGATSTGCGAVTISGFNQLFGNLLSVIVPVAAVGLFIMITIGGFKYITSGGNPKATEAAKNTLTYALLGMVLVGAAYLILQLVESFTGASVTQFDVVVPN